MAVVVWVVLLDFDDRLVRRSAPRRRLLESIELFLLRALPLQEYEAYVKEEANLRFRFLFDCFAVIGYVLAAQARCALQVGKPIRRTSKYYEMWARVMSQRNFDVPLDGIAISSFEIECAESTSCFVE